MLGPFLGVGGEVPQDLVHLRHKIPVDVDGLRVDQDGRVAQGIRGRRRGKSERRAFALKPHHAPRDIDGPGEILASKLAPSRLPATSIVTLRRSVFPAPDLMSCEMMSASARPWRDPRRRIRDRTVG